MFFNEMQLKAYYEMKKEEMEGAILTSKHSRIIEKARLYRKFFFMLNNGNSQKKNLKERQNCCNITIQQVCCEN